MTIKKQYLKSKPEVKVTFEIEKEDALDATHIDLLCEHNEWQAIAFKKLKSGKFKVAFNISTQQAESYQCIFQATTADGQQVMLLPTGADAYVDNGMNDGGQNAVIKLTSLD